MLFIYFLDIQTSVDGQTRTLDKDKPEQNSHKQGIVCINLFCVSFGILLLHHAVICVVTSVMD